MLYPPYVISNHYFGYLNDPVTFAFDEQEQPLKIFKEDV
jgi:hypothetical protein